MELHALKIRFYPKQKAKDSIQHVLYMRLLLNGKRAEISLNYQLEKSFWSIKEQTLKGKHPDKGYVLNLSNQYRQNALAIQNKLIQTGQPYDVFSIKDMLAGKSLDNKTVPTLHELLDQVIDRKRIISGPGNSKATIQKYKRIKAHISIFLWNYYKMRDISFNGIDLKFVENFEVYLKTTGCCAHNSAMKYVQTFKTIHKSAIAHGWATKDPFQKFKISLREVVRNYLTEKEIKSLLELDLPPNKFKNVRDLFIFSCFTGLAYIDLFNLSVKNFFFENGKYWIRTRRQKTNIKSNIPLLAVPLKILKEHLPEFENADSNKKIFRVISNQKANAYLKELATLARIDKVLTFHIARHSFATTITLNNGVPIESVSAMLGHKHISTTQHYAKLLDKKLENDMKILDEQLTY